MSDRAPGWYVVNRAADGTEHVFRGPYRYSETAVEIRRELESRATEAQESLWNLCVVQVLGKYRGRYG